LLDKQKALIYLLNKICDWIRLQGRIFFKRSIYCLKTRKHKHRSIL